MENFNFIVIGGIAFFVIFAFLTMAAISKGFAALAEPPVDVEGSDYQEPVTYSVLLLRGCDTSFHLALREWCPSMPLSEAVKLSKERNYLAVEISAGEATRLADAILKHSPSSNVQIICNKYSSTFTLKEWKEFHND